MIYGLGVDITVLARIHAAQSRNPHFATKILTENELAVFTQLGDKRALEFLAGRFSLKEAYGKAYGTGLGPVQLHDVECLNDANGRPEITKHPYAGKAFVSISHTDELVMTEVILEVAP
ncbi:holo-ACP synthase [Lacticaseibacillus baoqingensis]|uniref:Holo-[acyl-carrier-protein] synthase n=1 Tax=Lacticaseibacillus baoqingensis TaxID=2486013 RepID=A0ABW4EB82_9LACO|nr:holo-ACP synthase [Lacticaseibacillus baoqingensis]